MDAENQAVMGERQSVHRRQRIERASSRAAQQARQRGEEAAGKARRQISDMLSDQKHRAVEELDHIGSVLQSTSDNLRTEHEERIARYIESAVHQIENAATYLEEHSIDDIAAQVQRFARREPALFLGGAALIGLIGARFFRSSGRHDDWDESEYGPAWARDDNRNLRDLEGYDTVHGTSGAVMPDPDRRSSQTPIGSESTLGTRSGVGGSSGMAGSTGTMGGTTGGIGSSTGSTSGTRSSGSTSGNATTGPGSTGSPGSSHGAGSMGSPGTPGSESRPGSTSQSRIGESRRPRPDEPGEPW